MIPCRILILIAAGLLPSVLAGASGSTPAERKIEQAQKAIERNPDYYRSYNQLAMALARRARETADSDYYRQALAAVEASLERKPGNYGARKARVWSLLGQHEFSQALEGARALNKLALDDVQVYGFLADAHTALGHYHQAEEAVQWMLDLRPGNVPGLTRGAYLRELYGFSEGALEFLRKAYGRTPPSEVEDRAWILTHMAHVSLGDGRPDSAERFLDQAVDLFPEYHYALGKLAEVRMAQERFVEAVELFKKRYELAPHPENLFDVALALEKAGRADDAVNAYHKFERLGRAEMNSADNCNLHLVFYYSDHAGKPGKALRIARREIERRQDVFTRDAYAWALFQAGDYEQAHIEIGKALAPGIRDAKFFYHAGAIAAKQGDEAASTDYWKRSLDANPHSPVAPLVRRALDRSREVQEARSASRGAPGRD